MAHTARNEGGQQHQAQIGIRPAAGIKYETIIGFESGRRYPTGRQALASKMHYDKQQRVRWKADFLRLIVGARLDDARRHMLVEFIETYMMLPRAEQQAFEQLVAVEPEYEGVTTVMTIYEKRGVEKGREEGEVAGLRQALLVAAQSSFGEVPQALSQSVRETDDAKALTALLSTICKASSLDEVLKAL